MLGHISREVAAKYVELLNSGKVIEASVTKIAKEGPYINIYVRVVYEQSDDQLTEKHSSRLWQSTSVLPTQPGIYAIRNIDSGRQYIGSSNNIKDRLSFAYQRPISWMPCESCFSVRFFESRRELL